MRTSESISALAAALAKAQAVIEGAVKDRANPAFRSKYADLSAVWDAIRGPLTSNGLSLVQMPDIDDGEPVLVTRLLHESGEWLEGTYLLRPIKEDPQGYGSAITYARRYAAMAVCGVAPEDDDGNAASGRTAVAAIKDDVKPKPPAIPAELKAEADNLRAIIDDSTGEIALKLIMKNSAGLLERLGKYSPSAVKWLENHAEKHLAMLLEKE
jgi:hypothetical protein